jgi:cytochrome P450
MILNPDVQTKVQQELNQNFGNKKAKMTEKHKIPYTEAVIHEIHRRANILPLSVFHCTTTQTSIDIGKYTVPPKTVFILFIGDIMNDPSHFPEHSKGETELDLCRGIWYGNLQFWPKRLS